MIFSDVDGVVADWNEGMRQLLGLPNHPGFPDRWKWVPDGFRLEGAAYREFLSGLPPMVHPLDFPRVAGWVTHRPAYCADATGRWLASHGFSGAVYTVENRADKVPLLKRLGCSLFIEDNPDTWAECMTAGIPCLLVDRPYNRGVDAGAYRISRSTNLRNLHHSTR